jgi:thymidine kinase
MATVQQLIEQLSKIADKEQIIVFQYYLDDDFIVDFEGHEVHPTQEVLAEAAAEVDKYLWAYEELADVVQRIHDQKEMN